MVFDMSRGPSRTALEICGDCSAPDPKWASINRGILMCDECCSVHRSLGRHISQVRSLKKGSWSAEQLACVKQLVNSGANNIWEYSLLDPTFNKQSKRKPNPRDPLHPIKADFIRAKYQFLAYTKKYKEEDIGSVTDMSKQLHSSVRTNNLETSLRLLSLGADPNFFHQEKGNRGIHVAAQTGQMAQIELLIIYGADPGAIDSVGKTAFDYAKDSFPDIANRLIECQYELTDTLAYYLCHRKPDHRSGQHFIIPEMADSLDVSDHAKTARRKLQALPNNLFEELAMDVYDEVDRRENDAVWNATKNPNTNVSDRQTVPFLPVNPDFSSTRNQGRQKLARFNAREFATLIIDILNEAKRRQNNLPLHDSTLQSVSSKLRDVKTSSFSDDEPAYDTVASEEDYGSLGDRTSLKEPVNNDQTDDNQQPIDSGETQGPLSIAHCEEMELRMSLVQSRERIAELERINKKLEKEVSSLQNIVKQLTAENVHLKTLIPAPAGDVVKKILSPTVAPAKGSSPPTAFVKEPPVANGTPTNKAPVQFRTTLNLKSRPHSMVETTKSRLTAVPIDISTNLQTAQSGSLTNLSSKCSTQETNKVHTILDVMTESMNDNDSLYDNDNDHIVVAKPKSKQLPSPEALTTNTELITKKIQELLQIAKENKHESFVKCSDNITKAVDTMIDLFPLGIENQEIQSALSKLKSGAMQLCQEAKVVPTDSHGQADYKKQTQQMIQCAYNIAKAAKSLVTCLQPIHTSE